MNPWLPDSNPIANNNHGGFAPSTDGSMAFLQPPTTINPSQFQNQPYLNGAGRTASPAFHNPSYQTNPIIPSKRQREDSLGASPRQAPGGLTASRSQTPGQGAYPGFTPQVNGAPTFSNAPNPYQHLQASTASNATPSPTIQQMNFNQTGVPQRMATASPNSFSPHHGAPHMSPAPSDHISRGGTPHDTPQNFMPGSSFPGAFNPAQFGQMMGGNAGQMTMNQPLNMAQQHMQPQGMSAAQRNYQLQVQAQARQIQQAAQARSMNGAPPQTAQLAALQKPTTPTKQNSPEEFLRSLQAFMAARNRPVDLNPIICSRPIQLMPLYATVMKAGGSAKLTKLNQWAYVAQQFGFPTQQIAHAAQEMQSYWLNNLAAFENMIVMQNQQKQQMRMAAQGGMQNQMSPTRNGLQDQAMNSMGHQRSQSDLMTMRMNSQMINNQQASMNGFGQTTQSKDLHEPGQAAQHRPNQSRQFEPQQVNGVAAQTPQSTPQKRPPSSSDKPFEAESEAKMPVRKPIEDPFEPEFMPVSRFHGPINVDDMFALGQSLLEVKPSNPNVRDLGVIDIHALTMAIKSGMHAETRLALDTLVTVSTEQSIQLSLAACDDLMETLIDCAQDQVDFLVEHAAEVSDEMLLLSYEELVRGCRMDAESLQDTPEFGSIEYDLEKASDRLVCITTLIRNFSFLEANHGVLGMPEVITFLSGVVRYLGTKEMVLRSNRNTLDFMKDVVIFLSNLSHSVQLPGKEEALCLLHFLLSFAPTPPPLSSSADRITFTMYNPSIHKYMPSAVDSLAKLLARDEPNRTYYKAIFSTRAEAMASFELLTRAFGLAISPLPTNPVPRDAKAVVEARKPFLLQGMLAAEILSGLAPGSENGLAKSWLDSSDGFAAIMLRLVSLLAADRTTQAGPRPPHHAQQGRSAPEHDPNAYGAIANRAMAVLKALVQKARTTDEEGRVVLPAGVMPQKEAILGAMLREQIDLVILRQLCAYASLDE